MWKGSIWSHKNFFLWYTGINTLYLLPKICINCCFQFLLERRFIPMGNWKHWFMHIFGGTQSVSWEQWKQSIHIPFTFIEHFLINYMDTWLIILKELTMTFTALQCFCWSLFYIGLWAISCELPSGRLRVKQPASGLGRNPSLSWFAAKIFQMIFLLER